MYNQSHVIFLAYLCHLPRQEVWAGTTCTAWAMHSLLPQGHQVLDVYGFAATDVVIALHECVNGDEMSASARGHCSFTCHILRHARKLGDVAVDTHLLSGCKKTHPWTI